MPCHFGVEPPPVVQAVQQSGHDLAVHILLRGQEHDLLACPGEELRAVFQRIPSIGINDDVIIVHGWAGLDLDLIRP